MNYTFKSIRTFFTGKMVCLAMIMTVNEATAQDIIHKKNTIHGAAATFIYIGSYEFNYERSILTTRGLQTFFSAGFGGWYATTITNLKGGYSAPLSFNSLIGKGDKFFEVDLGARYIIYNEKYGKATQIIPVIKLGYRYQRRDGKGLIFRAFIGLTGVGIGLGKAF